ncbi:ParB/RepB/Spo0J family partition protein [Amaricoccus solimangrovi]|uniref:Replication protein n=1 Tax=Amaricoccus solimangrovi TaxID=2589815 RepID=A0A501WYL5_9RHOB|nr:ParB N-terminal domain-containing protein [Amaricoccus solimangrovi]TPE51046.1 replication protein [Amaricoccus solimangrovi]
MRKRRIFDLDMPEEPEAAPDAAPGVAETFPAGKVTTEKAPRRRGPMATAVHENAEALRARAEAEAAIRAENDALAGELVRLRGLGLIVDLIPLDAIDATKLARDRMPGEDLELAELKASIRDIGLSNPIRVEPAGQGRYELIQGMRRLTAFRELRAETGEKRYAAIPAGLMTDAEGLDQLYRRMVDENMVRKDISFMEMATMARDYARDPGTACDDPEKAVAILFQSAGYQKRSYIRAFLTLVDLLGDVLEYPRELPRGLGLDLRRRLDAEPGIVAEIRAELAAREDRTAEGELGVLRRWAGAGEGGETFPAGKKPAVAPRPARKARMTFEVPRAEGPAKCTAANGRLEIRLALDFSTIDRRRLEEAVRRMLDQVK